METLCKILTEKWLQIHSAELYRGSHGDGIKLMFHDSSSTERVYCIEAYHHNDNARLIAFQEVHIPHLEAMK